MKRSNFLPLLYDLRARQAGMLWFPAALLALFAVMVAFFRGEHQSFDMARGFLGVVLPLVGGILAAYAVVDDPVLELEFATPRRAARMLVERLGVVLGVLAAAALVYQLYLPLIGVDLRPLGGLAQVQMDWLVPCLVMISLGSLLALAFGSASPASLLIGLLWIFEFAFRDGFAALPVGQYLLFFLGALYPDHPALAGNQAFLLALAAVFLLAGWALLKKQERYI